MVSGLAFYVRDGSVVGDGGSGASVDLLVMDVGGRRCALPLGDVVEVQRMVAVVALPEVPDVVEGVIDVRGEIVPVLDIRMRFGVEPREVSLDDHLVVARAGTRKVAIRVDAAVEVRRVPAEDVDTTSSDVPGVAHVAGVARDDEGLVLVHDLSRFLSWEETDRLDEAMQRERSAV